ncbi:tetratricopeptide repeat protein [Amycolatopsis sp. NPDC004378]
MSHSAAAPEFPDVPVPADYDGDGIVDVAWWQPATGRWRIELSGGGSPLVRKWGQAGDLPVPAAYDGPVALAVLRPADGTLHVKPVFGGQAWTRSWGSGGPVPAAGECPGMGKLADALLGLASRLSQAGRIAEAVEPAKQAWSVLRRLTTAEASYRTRLAPAAVLCGSLAGAAARHDEAVAATIDAVATYHILGDQRGLAWALENLAARFSAARRYAAAFGSARECVEVYRSLAAGDASVKGEWGRAAVLLGSHAGKANLHTEAVAAGLEGTEVFRDLGDRLDLAWALENLAARYSAAGRYDEAVTPARECRDLHRALAEGKPASPGPAGA